MRPPRFRLRTLMIAVVAIGATLAAAKEGHRLWAASRSHQQRAAAYGRQEALCRRLVVMERTRAAKYRADVETYRRGRLPDDADDFARTRFAAYSKPGSPISAAEFCHLYMEGCEDAARGHDDRAAKYDKDAEWAAQFRKKFDRAARYPWLSVAPVPPPPK